MEMKKDVQSREANLKQDILTQVQQSSCDPVEDYDDDDTEPLDEPHQ